MPARCSHEPLQRRFDLENHTSAARGDERNIAAELNCIAESLLAVEQDRSCQRYRRRQARAVERKLRIERAKDASLFRRHSIFGQPTLEIAGQESAR